MLIEIQRFKRRFLGTNVSNNWIASVIILMLLAFFVGLIYLNEVHYLVTAEITLVVLTIVVPLMLHSAIAGERERRSWDMLLVAPVTKAQIVVGKYIGAALAILGILVAFAIPLLVSDFPDQDRLATGTVILLLGAAYALLLAAFTLLVSAMSKRSITALGTVYGSLFLMLLVFPLLLSMTAGGDAESILFLHPFFAVSQVNAMPLFNSYTQDAVSAGRNSYLVYGGAHVILYLGLALGCLYVATSSLSAAGWEDPSLTRLK